MADNKHLLGSEFLQSVLSTTSWKRIKAQKGQAVAELLEGLCGYWGRERFSLVELQRHDPSELIPLFEFYAERQFEAYAEELLNSFTGTVDDFAWHLATDVIDVISNGIRPQECIIPEDPTSKHAASLVKMLRDLEPGSEEQQGLAKWLSNYSGDWEIYLQRSFRRQVIKEDVNVPPQVTLFFGFKYVYHLRLFRNWRAFDLRLHAHLSNRLTSWIAKAHLQLPEKRESRSDLPVSSKPTPLPTGENATKPGTDWNTIEISFLSDERVQIRNGTNSETRNYSELGFVDRRNSKPNRARVTLRALAQTRGTIRNGATIGCYWSKLEKRMQEIRKVPRYHFGISTDPIPFVPGTGYQACFKIGCSPSFQT